ncbi:TenA family transcriptional regulator [Nitrospirillum iridis]|uniref:Pyrroloquinoline quinone (PQQ) biosynthesis protein C n=1 Tax=Nitrospirillum iridis TaxID=765888 RepID=A0A7X0EE90_9PROT|nr:iron-containing redox enzyme family protein [Nitrospirillum iridis]MBB6251204.1 pyrroloquinoline quinone (PQQ) biosynthesis protein C [Nitrospirillum iridis]
MNPTRYHRLLADTTAARDRFLAIPVLTQALSGGITPALYLAFLEQAYHHVRHTCRLLALAAARTEDTPYREALFDYIAEERGHEAWILDDIAALGGDAVGVASGQPGAACSALVGYVHYAIDRISPYAMLGMVHVLEGMSTLLAQRAADALSHAFRHQGGAGFRYLTTHGALDVDHVAFFERLVNTLCDPDALPVITETARVVYQLYGDIFRDLGQRQEVLHAA